MGDGKKQAQANGNGPWNRPAPGRRWLAAAVVMFAAAVLAGSWSLRSAFEDAAVRIVRTGTVRVGYAVEPPYAFVDAQGRVTGESPEVARAVWRRLGVERIEWVQADFASLIPQLRAGRIDQIACGLFIRPERAELVDFTTPSVCIEPALLVRKGNPLRLHSFQDFAGREGARLAVLAGAVEGEDAVRAGVPEDRVVAYPHPGMAMESLQSGLTDGLALSAPTIQELARQHPDTERAMPFHNPTLTPGCGAFAFRLEDRALRNRFDRELRGFIGGTAHLSLIEPFGFTRESVPGRVGGLDKESTP